MPSHTEKERLKRRIEAERERTGREFGTTPPRPIGGAPTDILTTTDQGATVVIQGAQGKFTAEETMRGFANELRQLRAESAAGIISDPGRRRLDVLETLLEERAAQES